MPAQVLLNKIAPKCFPFAELNLLGAGVLMLQLLFKIGRDALLILMITNSYPV